MTDNAEAAFLSGERHNMSDQKWSSAYNAANYYVIQSRTGLEKLEGIKKRILMKAKPEKWIRVDLDEVHGRLAEIHSELVKIRDQIK